MMVTMKSTVLVSILVVGSLGLSETAPQASDNTFDEIANQLDDDDAELDTRFRNVQRSRHNIRKTGDEVHAQVKEVGELEKGFTTEDANAKDKKLDMANSELEAKLLTAISEAKMNPEVSQRLNDEDFAYWPRRFGYWRADPRKFREHRIKQAVSRGSNQIDAFGNVIDERGHILTHSEGWTGQSSVTWWCPYLEIATASFLKSKVKPGKVFGKAFADILSDIGEKIGGAAAGGNPLSDGSQGTSPPILGPALPPHGGVPGGRPDFDDGSFESPPKLPTWEFIHDISSREWSPTLYCNFATEAGKLHGTQIERRREFPMPFQNAVYMIFDGKQKELRVYGGGIDSSVSSSGSPNDVLAVYVRDEMPYGKWQLAESPAPNSILKFEDMKHNVPQRKEWKDNCKTFDVEPVLDNDKKLKVSLKCIHPKAVKSQEKGGEGGAKAGEGTAAGGGSDVFIQVAMDVAPDADFLHVLDFEENSKPFLGSDRWRLVWNRRQYRINLFEEEKFIASYEFVKPRLRRAPKTLGS